MTEKTRLHLGRDVLVALVLLTRLPMPRLPDQAFAFAARAVWAYPLAGLLLGGLSTLAGLAGLAAGLPAPFAAGIVLAVGILLSGAMHEDGLADVADGFWGGQTPERRLEIMKDSRIGAFGTLALLLSCGLRWSGYAALLATSAPWAIVAGAALSRAVMPVLMVWLPHARPSGLSHSVGRPGGWPVLAGLVLASGVGVLLAGGAGLGAAAAALLVALAFGSFARARIGGQTGDVLGAAQQLAEIACLAVLVAALA